MTRLTAQQLVEKIKVAAIKGNFPVAQRLREILLDNYTFALPEIIAAAEIIETQMAAHMDTVHINTWHKLYHPLSKEEQNALFYTTKAAQYDRGKILFSQGKMNARLFFIDGGEVNLVHKKEEELHLVGNVSTGSITGEDVLLDITLPTFSAICRTKVQLRYLDKKNLIECGERFPGLPRWLVDFCLQHSREHGPHHLQKFEKRRFQRLPMQGTAKVWLLTADGMRTTNSFRGEMQDISGGGMNFSIRCTKRKTAQALLTQLIELNLGNKLLDKNIRGQIIRVGFLLHNDYNIHVRFGEKIPESTIIKIAGPKKKF